ncbi:hypothetical protein CFRS1_v001935 [Colletotrichum fructicola]|nr:hypothetical protein CFRS1_v001935 [Colletotrichum fructicola]
MAGFTLMFTPTAAVYGRSGYNKDGDEEENNKGRSGYNKDGNDDDDDKNKASYPPAPSSPLRPPLPTPCLGTMATVLKTAMGNIITGAWPRLFRHCIRPEF